MWVSKKIRVENIFETELVFDKNQKNTKKGVLKR